MKFMAGGWHFLYHVNTHNISTRRSGGGGAAEGRRRGGGGAAEGRRRGGGSELGSEPMELAPSLWSWLQDYGAGSEPLELIPSLWS